VSTTRGFRYPLEPVHQQRVWKLEAAQARLAQLQSERIACTARVRQLDADCTRDAGAAATSWERVRHPGAQAGALAYLAQLQSSIQHAREVVARIDKELEQAREECAARQRDCEALEQHRDESLHRYRSELQRRAAAQADADWSVRRHGMGDTP
jgi:flagellar export protein FliJ